MKASKDKWIMFIQTPPPAGRVRFITNDVEDYTSMAFYDFLKFLHENYRVNKRPELRENLDSYQTIFLDGNSGDWEIENSKYNHRDFEFKELYDLKQIKAAENIEDSKNIVDKSKSWLDRFWSVRQKGGALHDRFKPKKPR